ncbi:MAG: alpha/beta hydrolase [Chloroflexota bacterium]|nr:alpha/beta hydrolase [Chloroflexota bacterium]
MPATANGIRHPKLDPDARAVIDAMPPHPPWSSLAPAEARAYPSPINAAPEAVASVTQRSIQGPGGWLALRIYRPSGASPHPALIYLHGGGFVFGGLETTDRFARAITNLVPCVAVSVDYRLSPETKYPGALEDCFAALRWVAGSSEELGIDPARIAVGGFSAGANLATGIATLARDRGGPPVAFQLLVQGMYDARCEAPTHQEFEGIVMTADDMRWFWAQYVRGPEDIDDPRVSPLRATDLRGVAPALVISGECDLLRDEGEAYGRRLIDAGVDTTVRRYDAMPHGFLSMPTVPTTETAFHEIAAALRSRFHGARAFAKAE